MTHEIKSAELQGLSEVQLMAYLLSCHKDRNILGRALVRTMLMRQGVAVPAVFFDVVCENALTGNAGYYYPEWRDWSPGYLNCPYCNGMDVGTLEHNNVDDGNVRGSQRICFACGCHGPSALC